MQDLPLLPAVEAGPRLVDWRALYEEKEGEYERAKQVSAPGVDPAQAPQHVKVGTLICDISGGIGLIIASLVNFFLHSPMLYWLTTYAGIAIFVGLTAYDTQKIKELNVIGNAGTDEDHKEAIHGALILYLDFINLFLYLLRLLGRRR